jgi:hypothetical protein
MSDDRLSQVTTLNSNLEFASLVGAELLLMRTWALPSWKQPVMHFSSNACFS